MNGFERRRERKKTQIRDAALLLLMEDGERATIKEIANEAQVSQVSIYNFFQSKDALFLDVLKSYMETALAQYRRLLEDGVSFPEIIQKVMCQESIMIRVIHAVQGQISHMDEFVKLVKQFQQDQLIPYFIALADLGKANGYIASSLRTSDLLFYFSMYQREFSRLSAQLQTSQQAGGDLPSEDVLIRFFFYGLTGRPENKGPGKGNAG